MLPKVGVETKTNLIGANRGLIKNILTNCDLSSKTKLKDVCNTLYSKIMIISENHNLGGMLENNADSVFSTQMYPTNISVDADPDEEFKPHLSIQ